MNSKLFKYLTYSLFYFSYMLFNVNKLSIKTVIAAYLGEDKNVLTPSHGWALFFLYPPLKT